MGGGIMHLDKTTHGQCRLCFFIFGGKYFRSFYFQFSESADSRCKMSSKKRRHRVPLAKKRVADLVRLSQGAESMQGTEKTILY